MTRSRRVLFALLVGVAQCTEPTTTRPPATDAPLTPMKSTVRLSPTTEHASRLDPERIGVAITLVGRGPAAQLLASRGAVASLAAPPQVSTTPRLVWQNVITGERVIWDMLGPTYAGTQSGFNVDPVWDVAASADFSGDGQADVVWQNKTSGERVIWVMNGASYTGTQSGFVVNTNWDIVAAADFSGDGKPDLVWQNKVTGERVIWTMNGTSYSGSQSGFVVSPAWNIAGAADFTGDGKSDIVWQNAVTGERVIWQMNGATYSGVQSSFNVGINWAIAAAADFTADGHADLVWQNRLSGERVIWQMNRLAYTGVQSSFGVNTNWEIAATMSGVAGTPTRLALSPSLVAIDVATSATLTTTYLDASGNVVPTVPTTFTSRNATIATVTAAGVITGVTAGQVMIVASSTSQTPMSDSVLVVVTPALGVAVYADINQSTLSPGQLISIPVTFDMRSSGRALGSAIVTTSWSPALLSFEGVTLKAGTTAINAGGLPTGSLTFAIADHIGFSGKVVLATLSFRVTNAVGTAGVFGAAASEANADDLSNLLTKTVNVNHALIVR